MDRQIVQTSNQRQIVGRRGTASVVLLTQTNGRFTLMNHKLTKKLLEHVMSVTKWTVQRTTERG